MLGIGIGLPQVACQSSWSPGRLWPAGASSPGMWIDGPSYPAACFQDSAGTTALSTVGTVLDSSNPVGLMLDRKNGLALGAELAPGGGTFDSSTGWNVPAEWSISGGVATHSGTINNLTPSTPILTIGKTYQIQVNILAAPTGFQVSAGGTYSGTGLSLGVNTLRLQCTADTTLRLQAATGQATVLESISVKEIPGIHLTQSTSAARPVASGRKNALVHTSDLLSSAWGDTFSVALNDIDSPNGKAAKLTRVVPGPLSQFDIKSTSTNFVFTFIAKNGTASPNPFVYQSSSVPINVETSSLSNGFVRYTVRNAAPITVGVPYSFYIIASGTTIGEYLWVDQNSVQVEFGTVATSYQRVGAASDYTTTGFPAYLKFDGVDDALSSATFSAGTLTSSMDCLIAVRRDSAGSAILGFSTLDGATPYFGAVQSGGSFLCNYGVGVTGSTWVDGVQLGSFASVIAETLHTAVTPGAWHILEFHDLDLSAWTKLIGGGFAGYRLNGALGEIQLFASGQDANRDKARARMASYFGVTLP